MQNRNSNIIAIEKKSLTNGPQIAAGNFGTVYLRNYTGDNPDIKWILQNSPDKQPAIPNTLLAIKIAKDTVDINELKAIQLLNDRFKNETNLPFPKSKNIQVDQDPIAIASEFIPFSGSHSYDLQKYISILSANIHLATNTTTSSTSEEAVKRIFRDLSNSMAHNQYALHEKHIVHLDTALRNFLICEPQVVDEKDLLFLTKIIDFGNARGMDENGLADPVDMTGNQVQLPFIRYNNDLYNTFSIPLPDSTLFTQYALTVHTDIFSLKATIIEMLAVLIGKSEISVLKLDPTKPRGTIEDYLKERINFSDEALLQRYVDNIKYFANEMPNDPRSKIVMEFLTCYEKYLTSMPQRNQPLESILKQDLELLQEADKNYAQNFNYNFTSQELLDVVLPYRSVNIAPVTTRKQALSGYDSDTLSTEPSNSLAASDSKPDQESIAAAGYDHALRDDQEITSDSESDQDNSSELGYDEEPLFRDEEENSESESELGYDKEPSFESDSESDDDLEITDAKESKNPFSFFQTNQSPRDKDKDKDKKAALKNDSTSSSRKSH